MAGLTDADRHLIRRCLYRAGNSGIKWEPGWLPGPEAVPVLVGQLAGAQRELCDLIRLCERLDRRIEHLERLIETSPRRAAVAADRLDYGPVPYRLTRLAEAYLSGTDARPGEDESEISKACSTIIFRDASV